MAEECRMVWCELDYSCILEITSLTTAIEETKSETELKKREQEREKAEVRTIETTMTTTTTCYSLSNQFCA